MTTEQHLELIVEFCERNLAIAGMQTQGGTCARSADAGWKATISAIQWAQEIECLQNDMIDDILAAYPLDLIKEEKP